MDLVSRKAVLRPKLAGCQRLYGLFLSTKLQYISDAQPFYRHMFFVQVAVERRLTCDFRGHVLNILRRSFDYRP